MAVKHEISRRRLWVCSELYYPEDTSTGYFITQIAEAVARVGHWKVHAISARPTYARRGAQVPWSEIVNEVNIKRVWGLRLNKDNLLYRIVNTITFCTAFFVHALRNFNKNDTILVVTNPPVLPFVAWAAAAIRGSKCILLVHDLYPEAMVAADLISPRSVIANIIRFWVSLSYQSMCQIVVIGRDMRDLLLECSPSLRSRVAVITNWADIAEIYPLNRSENEILEQLQLTDKFVVQVAGNIGRTHDIDVLCEAAQLLASEPNIHFIVVSEGTGQARLASQVKDRGLANITFLPRQPRERLNVLLNACDVAIIPLRKAMIGVSVPSRMYNILSVGRPLLVLADPKSEIARTVKEANAGCVLAPGDSVKLARCIRTFANAPDLVSRMSKAARMAAISQYKKENILEKWVQLVDAVANSHECSGMHLPSVIASATSVKHD